MLLANAINLVAAQATTALIVNPPTYTAEAGETFSEEVAVLGVLDLYGWEFKLGFDPALTVEEVQISAQFYSVAAKEGDGYILVAGTLLGDETPISGDITLATITFQASVAGEYAFDLYDTKLANDLLQPIEHYVIDGVPLIIHDIALLKLEADPSGWIPVPRGDPIYIEVTAGNAGNFTETFDLYVYADSDVTELGDELIIGQATVTLEAGSTTLEEFVWDTTDAPYGSYYLSAEATTVEGETNIENNFIGAGAFVGGICRPWQQEEADFMPFFISTASSAMVVGILAAFGVGLLRALGTVRMPQLFRKKR
jgi:hypothetical protein